MSSRRTSTVLFSLGIRLCLIGRIVKIVTRAQDQFDIRCDERFARWIRGDRQVVERKGEGGDLDKWQLEYSGYHWEFVSPNYIESDFKRQFIEPIKDEIFFKLRQWECFGMEHCRMRWYRGREGVRFPGCSVFRWMSKRWEFMGT